MSGDTQGGATPGWMDQRLIDAMRGSDDDVGQHTRWWMGMNNGMSKSWLMQDGKDPKNTRYSSVDGAPWAFVYECRESSLPQASWLTPRGTHTQTHKLTPRSLSTQEALDAVYLFSPHSMLISQAHLSPSPNTLTPRSLPTQEALDAVYLFSPHSMLNLRNAVVPTATLMPRVESMDPRRWKVVGVWKKRTVVTDQNDMNDDDVDDDDDDNEDNLLSAMRRSHRRGGGGNGGIHDMALDQGMPMLGGRAEGTDLENISPVRIEAWMPRVFHYAQDAERTGDTTVHRKMFCILTVTPVRNLNLAEYMRHTVVENTQGTFSPGMSQSASELMRKDKKDMLHRLLLGQMELCGFFARGSGDRGGVPDPLDALNMPSTDYYPSNYLSIPMAYRRIQQVMRRQGYDHRRIYVEGFSDTVSMFTVSDLRQVKEHNNAWAPSFYSAVSEFDALKPEERSDYRARLMDVCPPFWPRRGGPNGGNQHQNIRQDDDDVEPGNGGGGNMDAIYTQRDRVPPVKVCLWYNPLMYMSPSCTRAEWEQQLGGFPAFFIYTMSRSIYSSASNPLLKPEYFMPEAKPMSTHQRWLEYMDDGDNPLAGYCVAGWACKQFQRVMDASREAVNVSEVSKVQMLMDYMQTCFNMHLGLIDTKSLRSKTVYWAHRLMREADETAHHDLVYFLRDEMRLGTDRLLCPGSRSQSGKPLSDGGYAQIAYMHTESLNILNRDWFHLNDLNLSLLWRMLVTTTHHCVGMNNRDLSAMGSSIVACRGGGHYTGRFAPAGSSNSNNGVANTYQALDKPNSVGGDYVVSHHSWMKSLCATASSSVRTFDNGQVPSDMTRFTEASMRMIGTVLVDEKNAVRREPADNLLSQYYQTEMQITNVDQYAGEQGS